MKYIHVFDSDNEFVSAYTGSDYLEPWVSATIETSGVAYNKFILRPIGYIQAGNFYNNFGLALDYNDDGTFNPSSPSSDHYARLEMGQYTSLVLHKDLFTPAAVDAQFDTNPDFTPVQEGGTFTTISGEQLATGDDGWGVDADIIRIANSNGEERWFMFCVGGLVTGGWQTYAEYIAIYDQEPTLENIAGGYFGE